MWRYVCARSALFVSASLLQVSIVDVAPTVLELAGIDVSPYRDELDGVSLVQYLEGLPDGEDPNLMPAVGGAVRSHLFIETPHHRAVVQAGSGWKYVLAWSTSSGRVAIACLTRAAGCPYVRCQSDSQQGASRVASCPAGAA